MQDAKNVQFKNTIDKEMPVCYIFPCNGSERETNENITAFILTFRH